MRFAAQKAGNPFRRKSKIALHDEPQGERTRAARGSDIESVDGCLLAIVEDAKILALEIGEQSLCMSGLVRVLAYDVNEDKASLDFVSKIVGEWRCLSQRGCAGDEGEQGAERSKWSIVHGSAIIGEGNLLLTA